MLNKVLCVDDDQVTRMICKVVVTNGGLTTTMIEAGNGQEALDVFKNDPTSVDIDLILLDINMPVKNGWDFLDEFNATAQQKFPKTKVAILSSSIDPDDVEKSKEYPNVICFLRKPFNLLTVEQLKNDPALAHHFKT